MFPWEIDRDATRAAVEERLESARIYKQIGFVRRGMKNTASWEPREHGATNAISKPAEDVATWNVDKEEELQERYEQVTRAVDRLNRTEKQIIEKRYLSEEDAFDYNVYSDMNLSERNYYRIKSGAIYKIAFALRLERYLDA